MSRMEFRIAHPSGWTRIRADEYFGNVRVGNLVCDRKQKRPGSVTFTAHVLPGLVAIKEPGGPLRFERQHRANWEQLEKKFRIVGYSPAKSRLLASVILEALCSETYYQGTSWPTVLRHLINWGSTREGELKWRAARSLPLLEGEPVIPGDPSTAFKLH